jgi:uncharacterized protein
LYPRAYIQFLAHFHGDRDYFECHEVLEEYWKETNDSTKDSIWVGFIQLAVSRYHHRRGNIYGAKKSLEKSIRIFSIQEKNLINLGLDKQILFPMLTGLQTELEKGEPYKSFNLPICDSQLLDLCTVTSEQNGCLWGKDSDIADANLVHRHTLRDRTSVIQERLESLKKRKGSK